MWEPKSLLTMAGRHGRGSGERESPTKAGGKGREAKTDPAWLCPGGFWDSEPPALGLRPWLHGRLSEARECFVLDKPTLRLGACVVSVRIEGLSVK